MDDQAVSLHAKSHKGKQCGASGCQKRARGSSGHCVGHGGTRFIRPNCCREGCAKRADRKGEACRVHGGPPKICSTAGCTDVAQAGKARCGQHKVRIKCTEEGSKSEVCYGYNVCGKHGARRCRERGCERVGKGPTRRCTRHGGGAICITENCKKGAREPSKFCKAHNGGRKCKAEGCSTNAVDGQEHCKNHGPRCSYVGCKTAPRTGYSFCVTHKGGKICKAPGCDKSAQGATNFCQRDGGGNRCCVCSDVGVRFSGGACYTCRS
jgi:hypothetical protein